MVHFHHWWLIWKNPDDCGQHHPWAGNAPPWSLLQFLPPDFLPSYLWSLQALTKQEKDRRENSWLLTGIRRGEFQEDDKGRSSKSGSKQDSRRVPQSEEGREEGRRDRQTLQPWEDVGRGQRCFYNPRALPVGGKPLQGKLWSNFSSWQSSKVPSPANTQTCSLQSREMIETVLHSGLGTDTSVTHVVITDSPLPHRAFCVANIIRIKTVLARLYWVNSL